MTNSEEVRRFDLVDCEVTGHQHYGLLFRTSSDRPGFIDSADIFDPSAHGHSDWPPVGARLTCVVLGVTRDGRIRASVRASDMELVREEADLQQALSEWRRIRDAGFADTSEQNTYLASARGKAILRWALRRNISSSDHNRAVEIIASAPESVRNEIQSSRDNGSAGS
jgi:hypothetical protein